ncbi:MAG TPA: sulfatase [Candidatus Binatia bacterium]|nr:sulfatase [Candidatus Binatia bacterium]
MTTRPEKHRTALSTPRSRREPPRAASRRRRSPAALVVALLAALAGGCERGARDAAPTRPNVLLVSFDTTRADHTSAYGYERPTTPRLAALLATSIRFDAAYAPMPTTMPSHSSMFTGVFPRTHGVVKNGLALAPGTPTLAAALSAAGYRTAGFVSSFVLDRRFGASQGFETWDDHFGEGSCKMAAKNWEGRDLEESFCRRGAETRARAESWLESNGYLSGASAGSGAAAAATPAPPFFLFVHFFDPHDPYAPLPEHAALFPPAPGDDARIAQQVAAYDGEIHYADEQLGLLLDRLAQAGILDWTLVVVVGDHGEGLMQHGWMNHGLHLYEEAVHVPLVVRWPARLAGGRSIAEPVELTDLTPTVLALAGVAAPDIRPQGRSLAGALTGGEKLDPERPVFLQRRHYEGKVRPGVEAYGLKVGVRKGRWKYIECKVEQTRELYDLASDPHELTNLVDAHGEEAGRLAATIEKWLSETPEAARGGVSGKDAERLRALGYVQ